MDKKEMREVKELPKKDPLKQFAPKQKPIQKDGVKSK